MNSRMEHSYAHQIKRNADLSNGLAVLMAVVISKKIDAGKLERIKESEYERETNSKLNRNAYGAIDS